MSNFSKYSRPNSEYIEDIDVLKGIAIFLVVFGHSIISYPINLHDNSVCEFVFDWLSSVHMPLFFMISGYCYSYKQKYKEYLWKKIKRLLIPYFIFSLIDIFPRMLLSNFVNRPRGIKESLVKVFFYGGEYWFLYTLFLLFLFYPLFHKYILEHKYGIIGYFIASISIVLLKVDITSVFCLDNIVYYLFYFSLGVIIKKYLGRKVFDTKINKNVIIPINILTLLVWIILVFANVNSIKFLTALVGILTIWLFIQYPLITALFKRFGKYSLQLYLLNGFLLVISRTIIVSVLGIHNPVLIISFNMLVDFVISYLLIKYIFEKITIIKFAMGMN